MSTFNFHASPLFYLVLDDVTSAEEAVSHMTTCLINTWHRDTTWRTRMVSRRYLSPFILPNLFVYTHKIKLLERIYFKYISIYYLYPILFVKNINVQFENALLPLWQFWQWHGRDVNKDIEGREVKNLRDLIQSWLSHWSNSSKLDVMGVHTVEIYRL